jgi:hypothetical protein
VEIKRHHYLQFSGKGISTSSAFRVLSSSLSAHVSLRDELTQVRDSFFFLLLVCTVLVAIGVALEEADNWLPSGRPRLNTLNGSFNPSLWVEWKRRLTRLGWILILLGVIGEGLFEGATSWADSKLQDWNNTLLLNAEALTGNAAQSAKTAHDEADAVRKKADALDIRLERASLQLGNIEQDILAQGPRWRLLEKGEDVFIKALKPFAGQQVTVVSCGNSDVEREGLEQALVNIFPKAGWNSPGYRGWAGCPNLLTGGNEIFFVAATDDSAEWASMPAQQWLKPQCGRFNGSHDALNTLCDVLYKLRIFTIAFREKPLPTEVGTQNARLFFGFGASEGPAELAYKDPGRIFLLIGPNAPMFTDKNKHAHKSTKPK